MNSIFHRVSIRKYEDRPVEQEKLLQILKAGMQAPSACNQQPWEFYVVTDKEMIQKLAGVSPYSACAAGAPVVIVPVYRKEGLIARPLRRSICLSPRSIFGWRRTPRGWAACGSHRPGPGADGCSAPSAESAGQCGGVLHVLAWVSGGAEGTGRPV